jgi:hypothetical protein
MAHVLEDVWDYTKGDPSAPPRFPPQVVKLSALLPSAQSLHALDNAIVAFRETNEEARRRCEDFDECIPAQDTGRCLRPSADSE